MNIYKTKSTWVFSLVRIKDFLNHKKLKIWLNENTDVDYHQNEYSLNLKKYSYLFYSSSINPRTWIWKILDFKIKSKKVAKDIFLLQICSLLLWIVMAKSYQYIFQPSGPGRLCTCCNGDFSLTYSGFAAPWARPLA